MVNIYVILSIGFGGILFGILLATVWIVFRNFKRRMLPDRSSQAPGVFQESYWEEKREHPRVGITWTVSMEIPQGVIQAKTKDLSLGGAFIVCPEPLALKERFPLTIDIPGQGPLPLNAEVVWSNSNVPEDKIVVRGMGVRFVGRTDKEIESLDTAISAFLEERE